GHHDRQPDVRGGLDCRRPGGQRWQPPDRHERHGHAARGGVRSQRDAQDHRGDGRADVEHGNRTRPDRAARPGRVEPARAQSSRPDSRQVGDEHDAGYVLGQPGGALMRRGIRRTVAGRRRGAWTALLSLAVMLWWSTIASAQLDPIGFVRRVPPTIIVIMDTSASMLQDGNGNYYDPGFWPTTDATVTPAFSLPVGTKTYRRIFNGMLYATATKYSSTKIQAVAAVWNPADALTSNNATDNAFLDPTRYAIAKAGLAAAIGENSVYTTRWGVVRLRQKNVAWRSTPGGAGAGGNDCDKAVAVSDATQLLYGDNNPCSAGGPSFYGVYAPKVEAANYLNTGAAPFAGTIMVAPAASTASAVRTIALRGAGDSQGFIPAGIGGIAAGA